MIPFHRVSLLSPPKDLLSLSLPPPPPPPLNLQPIFSCGDIFSLESLLISFSLHFPGLSVPSPKFFFDHGSVRRTATALGNQT
ncbi:hypothetical protein K1719_028274 [Acacia pycnantha]|nr:hypothetical protein K1719_028274 [Acacia pycnantha]